MRMTYFLLMASKNIDFIGIFISETMNETRDIIFQRRVYIPLFSIFSFQTITLFLKE